jgi:monooxygenase
VVLSQRMPYKGMMLAGVPNLVMTFGYVNASWTLRADLVSQWVVRLLARMDALGARIAVPRPTDGEVGTEPFSELSSGYFRRALDRLPMQSARAPWRFDQNYLRERRTIGRDAFDDGVLRFEGATAAGVAAGATAPAEA